MIRSTPLSRGTRLRSVSRKVQRGARAWAVVYAQVDARAQGKCEIGGPPHPWTERHHCFKPRRSFHAARYILAVCHEHHLEFEPRPYIKGRRVITGFDEQRGIYRTAIVTALDKFAARAEGLLGR